MKKNRKLGVAAIVFVAVVAIVVWGVSQPPTGKPIDGMLAVALNVDHCDATNNELTIRNVGDVDIEPREIKVYYLEDGRYTGLSGVITESIPVGGVTLISLQGGALEIGKGYFMSTARVPAATFEC